MYGSNQFLTMVNAFVVSGGLGYISYIALGKFGFLKVNKSETKNFMILLLSVISYVIYLIVIEKISEFEDSILLSISYSIIITFIILIIIFFVVFYLLLKLYYFCINKYRKSIMKKKIESSSNVAFNDTQNQKVYIFDFDHNFISEGFIKNRNETEKDGKYLLLKSDNAMKNSQFTEDEMIVLFNESYNNGCDTNIYLDIKDKLKYYIITPINLDISE